MNQFDVYAFGMICPSRLVVMKSQFPREGQYAEIVSTHTSLGGEAANSSVVLAALGLIVKFDGNWLRLSQQSRETIGLLSGLGVDTSRVSLRAVDGPEELVIASGSERTVLGNYQRFSRPGRKWNIPHKSDVENCRVVCLDPFFRKESLKAARYAQAFRKPYVTVDSAFTDPVAQGAAVVVISSEYHQRRYRRFRPTSLFRNYQKRCRGLVVITSGGDDILYGRNGSPMRRHKPPTIHPIDTSGAGDSFRAGMAYGLLKGLPDDESIRFSAGLAALNCLRFPGVLNSPSVKEVRSYLKRRIK